MRDTFLLKQQYRDLRGRFDKGRSGNPAGRTAHGAAPPDRLQPMRESHLIFPSRNRRVSAGFSTNGRMAALRYAVNGRARGWSAMRYTPVG